MNTDSRALFDLRLRTCAEHLARGGNAALGELFDLAAARLLRYAGLMTRNSHDAEDVVQSAFVRAVLHADQLAGARHPWAYLIQIVRNEALRFLQRRPAEVAAVMEAATEDEDLVLVAEATEEIHAALAELAPEQAEVVVLKLWEEMTFAEIAEVTGESPNTAASRYRYAIQKLRQRLKTWNEWGASRETGPVLVGADLAGTACEAPPEELGNIPANSIVNSGVDAVSGRGGARRRGQP